MRRSWYAINNPTMNRGVWRRGRSGASLRPALVTGSVMLAVCSAVVLWPGTGDTPYRTVAGPGHGRGMSQVGAFDSALAGQRGEDILGHYYPGATLGTVAPTDVQVRLTAQDDSTLDTYADAGLLVAGRTVDPGQVAHLTPLPDGGANVVVTAGCDGAVLWQDATDDPWVYPIDPGPARPAAEHLVLCGGTGYRGALGVVLDGDAMRTVNRVDVEDYLLGVVPAEVQANWVDKGATEALRAQAIAARSYALAEQRYSYAQTCDTTDCQVYPGTPPEDPRAAEVIASTAGTVLLRDGRILRAEYSAAPDGGEPADIYTFEVGPTPAELVPSRPLPEQQVGGVDPTPIGGSLIDLEYQRLGGRNGSVGEPIGPEMALPDSAGTYRMFSNGVIIATPDLGAKVVDFTTLMQVVPEGRRQSGPPGFPTVPSPSVLPPRTPVPTTAATPTPRPVPAPAVPSSDSTGFDR